MTDQRIEALLYLLTYTDFPAVWDDISPTVHFFFTYTALPLFKIKMEMPKGYSLHSEAVKDPKD